MIRRTVLENGARIITEVVNEVYSASVGIWVEVGSEDEQPKNNGVSHCLEHMLFKGTKTRSAQDIAQEIEDVGGALGAATSKENTCFYGYTVGEELHVALDLLLDMLKNASLKQKDLDLERQVILEEIKMYEDDPEDLCQETMLLNVWKNHQLGRPITGTRATVSSITANMLKEHVDKFYTAENLVISIAGKFNEKKTIAQLSAALSKFKRGEQHKTTTCPAYTPVTIIKSKDIKQAHISLAAPALKITDERRYQIAILDLCLGGNLSSRLFQEVREKRGLVYTINSYRLAHCDTGLFGVYAGTSPKNVLKVLKLIIEEFEKVKSEGFTKQEIQRAKIQLKSDLLLGLESMRNRSSRNAYAELFYGKPLDIDEIIRDVDKVTSAQIKKLANDILQIDALSLVLVRKNALPSIRQLPANFRKNAQNNI